MTADYAVWVLEYGRVPSFPVGALIYGAHNAGTRNVPFCYVLIKGNGKTVMIDTGMGDNASKRAMKRDYGLVDWQPPSTVLDRVGVDPLDVDTVVITHAHWDHIGNLDAFPNADIYIQGREIERWISAWSGPPRMRYFTPPVDPEDLRQALQLGIDGRLHLLEGDWPNFLPGIDLHAAHDTHTYGSMWVSIRPDSGTDTAFALAGDNVYVYENLDGWDGDGMMRPVGHIVGSHQNWFSTVEDMLRVCGGNTRRVIPVHEERIAQEFPTTISPEGLMIVNVLAPGEEQQGL